MLERTLAGLNAERRPDEAVLLVAYEPPGRFVLSFPDRPMPEGRCIDQDFSEIQFSLLEREKVYTDLRGGRKDEDEGRFHMEYALVEWD